VVAGQPEKSVVGDELLGDMPNLYVYAVNNPLREYPGKRRGYGTIIPTTMFLQSWTKRSLLGLVEKSLLMNIEVVGLTPRPSSWHDI
jgi:hypothetical protein